MYKDNTVIITVEYDKQYRTFLTVIAMALQVARKSIGSTVVPIIIHSMSYLPSPLIPDAPLERQVARSNSIGVFAVFFNFSIFALSSRFPLAVHVILMNLSAA